MVDYSTAKVESADGGVRMAAGASTHVLRDGLAAATSTSVDDDGSLSGHIQNDGPIWVLGKSRLVAVLHPNEPDFPVSGPPLVVPCPCALRAARAGCAAPLLAPGGARAEPGRSPGGNPDGKPGPVRAGPEPGTRMPRRRHWVRRTQVLEKGFTPDGSGPGALTLLGSAVQLRWSASKQAMTTAKQPSIMQLLAVATTIQSINGQMIHMGKVQISK